MHPLPPLPTEDPCPSQQVFPGCDPAEGHQRVWSARSLAQLRDRCGPERTQAVLTATTAKIIFGGLSSETGLRNIWDVRTAEVTHHSHGTDPTGLPPDRFNPLGNPDQIQGRHSIGGTYRPAMPMDALQQMPPGHAWLWWQSSPPLHVETRPAHRVPAYQHTFGYTP